MLDGAQQKRYGRLFCLLMNVFDPRVPCRYGCKWVAPFGTYATQAARAMTDDNVLSKIPGELLAPARNNLPQALPKGPDTQRLLIRLPDGTRAEVTYVKVNSKKGRSTRWFWTPDSAVLLDDDANERRNQDNT
jgi:hypothetical protein